MAVSRDATSGWYRPANAAEWTELLAGTGIANPISAWLCQEASGNLADSIASNTLTKFNAPLYQQTVAGWTSKAVSCAANADCFFNSGGALGDIGTSSHLLFAYVAASGTPTTTKKIMWLGFTGQNIRYAALNTTPRYALVGQTPQVTGTGASNPGTTAHPVLLQVNRAAGAVVVQTDQETIAPAYSAPSTGNAYMGLGPDSVGSASPTVFYLYAACWRGISAELDATQRATLLNRLQNGPSTAGVAIGRNRLVNAGRMGPLTKGSSVN